MRLGWQPLQGKRGVAADDARTWKVGLSHSSYDASDAVNIGDRRSDSEHQYRNAKSPIESSNWQMMCGTGGKRPYLMVINAVTSLLKY